MRRERDHAEEAARVRVFIDHWEFSLSWQIAYSGFTRSKLTAEDLENAQTKSQQIQWEALPDIILEHLDEVEYIRDQPKELRNVDIYASARRSGNQKVDNDFREWLEGTLDPLPGFQVYHFPRNASKARMQCETCGASLERPELQKGLKTKMACDLLSYAVEDLYDIAVLFADDAELSPSILCVQEIFDKKVIHVGLNGRGERIRSAAWGHIMMDKFIKDLFVPEDFSKRHRH
jgi:hypothetical protein